MGCKMTKAKKQRAKPSNKKGDEAPDLSQIDIMTLDRKQLQKLCKELGLKANGKTTELQENLKSYKTDDVNNNVSEGNEDHCVSEDQKMKEQISQSDENPDQVCDTTKVCPRKINNATKAKMGKQDADGTVGEKDKDGRKERKKGRGKLKHEKKPLQNKTGKDVIEEDVVTRNDTHLVDDDSFVIEKICKYDEASKYDGDAQRMRKSTQQTVQQNGDQRKPGKASSIIADTSGKNIKANGKKDLTKSGENQTEGLEDDVAEESKRTKVQASRRKKENKFEKSCANSVLGDIELEGKSSKFKSNNEVKTDDKAQRLDRSDKVRNAEMDGEDKTKTESAAKKLEGKANTKQKDRKKVLARLDKSLGYTKPVSVIVYEECVNEEEVNEECVTEVGVNEEFANEEDYNSDEANENLIVDVTGLTSDFGSCADEIEENKYLGTEISEAKLLNDMSTTRDFSYHLKTIELDLSCATEKECDSTFTIEENGHNCKETDEKDKRLRELSGFELSEHSCLQEKESDSSLKGKHGPKEGNSYIYEQEMERDSTFTVEEKDLNQTKSTELGNLSLMERGSSVSSTEDVDLKTDGSQRISKQSHPATSCTRWCVVEGVAKHDNELSWKRIKLKGGRPVVPNRFGKYIPFVLEPSNIDVPCGFRDNFICGLCVRDNERLNGERFGTTVPLATRKQRLASRRSDSHNASDDEDNETLLSTFTRGDGIRASVKRKRVEDHSRRTESQEGLELECQALLTKRQRNSLSTSNPRIPASPVVRKARGEKLKLPRNHKKAWRPKKSSRSMSPLKVVEDASFAQKVEAIIKTTLPGSEEELNMIMSKNCRVQRSPTKN